MAPTFVTRLTDQDRYFALDKRAGHINRQLAREDDPATRAGLLDELAVAEHDMADVHMAAFGPDPIEHEGGRDLSESLALSARLVRLLAGAEHELAGTPAAEGFMDEFRTLSEMQQHCLTGLFHTRDRDVRADMIDTFYDAVVDETGGQAAETLVSLALCEREAATRRPPRWRIAARWVWWVFEAIVNAAIALAVGTWAAVHVITTGASRPLGGIIGGLAAVGVFLLLNDLDEAVTSFLGKRRESRRCAACGNSAKPGDPIRFYRLDRRYPRGRVCLPYWVPRYEILRSHRSHLTDPVSGLYQPVWRRALRWSR